MEVIRIIDDTGRLIRAPDMEFRAEEIGLEAFGYNIANSALVSALFGRLAVESHVRHVPTKAVTALEPGPSTVRLETAERGMVSAKLAVGADGRNSITRAAAGIKTVSWSYKQTALTCTFGHSLDHDNISTEFHGPHGPFTTVPLPGRQSSLVWVERPAEAQRLMGLDDEDFAKAMERRLHGHLGDIAAAGRRASFPLKGLTARIFARRRVALISEAAHVLPPIGAQGLNLGFRDIIQLAAYVSKARAGGEDIGDDDLLRAYSDDRRGDVWSRSAAADLLNRSLLPGILPFQAARSIGLHILNIASPLRHFVMRQGLAPAAGKVS